MSRDETPTGHAVIQVVPSGENAICVTRPGASDSIPRLNELEALRPGAGGAGSIR